MSDFGIRLERLILSGDSVENAEIRFEQGLNLISGPSDTGKSFILQCIDFVFGARRPPKEIPEADSYHTVSVELRDANESLITLRRALRGGDIRCLRNDEEVVLKAKHNPNNSNTVSGLLLELTELADKRLRKNANGETVSLSFRNLMHLCVVNESDIIAERSPILTGRPVNKTTEESTFRLLLTGTDDSATNVVAEKTNLVVGRKAKADLLDEMIQSTIDRIADLENNAEIEELRDQFQRSTSFLEGVSLELTKTKVDVSDLESQRRDLWVDVRNAESRLQVLVELIARFELLEEQYQSDLRRLDAIAETGSLLNGFGADRCPICGALKKDHSLDAVEVGASPEAVSNASKAESQKVELLLRDLQVTQQEVAAEHSETKNRLNSFNERIRLIDSSIDNGLKPKIGSLVEQVQQTRAAREPLIRTLELHERLEELRRIAEGLAAEAPDDSDRPEFRSTSASDLENFSKAVEERLRAWNYPNLERVTFGERELDVVISGRRRSSHGQGVRAITHAAFNIAILDYCLSKSLPHPGFVVVGSPLLVYRQPDAGEDGFSSEVKRSFFADLAVRFNSAQIIVLDHEELPSAIDASGATNWIRFTGSDVGRRGFIPRKVAKDRTAQRGSVQRKPPVEYKDSDRKSYVFQLNAALKSDADLETNIHLLSSVVAEHPETRRILSRRYKRKTLRDCSATDLDDLVQEVAAACLVEYTEKFRETSNPIELVSSLCHRRIANHLADARRLPNLPDSDVLQELMAASNEESEDEVLELEKSLHALIEEVATTKRTAQVAHEVVRFAREEKPFRGAAISLGLKEQTVRNHWNKVKDEISKRI